MLCSIVGFSLLFKVQGLLCKDFLNQAHLARYREHPDRICSVCPSASLADGAATQQRGRPSTLPLP